MTELQEMNKTQYNQGAAKTLTSEQFNEYKAGIFVYNIHWCINNEKIFKTTMAAYPPNTTNRAKTEDFIVNTVIDIINKRRMMDRARWEVVFSKCVILVSHAHKSVVVRCYTVNPTLSPTGGYVTDITYKEFAVNNLKNPPLYGEDDKDDEEDEKDEILSDDFISDASDDSDSDSSKEDEVIASRFSNPSSLLKKVQTKVTNTLSTKHVHDKPKKEPSSLYSLERGKMTPISNATKSTAIKKLYNHT